MMRNALWSGAMLLSLGVAPLAAQAAARDAGWSRPSHADSTRLLYKGLGYGSDAYESPLTVQLNKGFDIFQLRNAPRNFWTFPYGSAWAYAIRDVYRFPGPAVERFGGWPRFTRVELLPLSFERNNFNWFANYTEHLIGGGLTMRMLDEWYDERGFPYPRLWAMASTYSAAILNEITEQADYKVTTSGTVADLMFFDIGAITLFHFDQPTRFFAKTLQAADWSNQASLTFPNKQLQNNGQYFTLKVPVGLERTRLFIRGGMGAQLGISQKLSDDEHHLSIGLGGDTQVRDIDKAGLETVGFAPGAGVYYDRNNSLLWSAVLSPVENLFTVNVYPNVLPHTQDVGVWALYTRQHQFRFGIVHRKALGLGIGYGK